MMGAFEAEEEERDAPDWLVAQINATVVLYCDRQIYGRDGGFAYRMVHNERIMRGDELLTDQAALRASETETS